MNKSGSPNYQPIAIVSRPVGLIGDVRLKPTSRYFEEYIKRSDLFISQKNASPTPIKIKSIKGFGRKKIFKIEGINSRNEAKIINGHTIFVVVPIDDKINQTSRNLINWNVISVSDSYIGKLVDIIWSPANDLYVVKNNDKEYLVPVVDVFVKKINYKNKEIIINPIDGLIE